MKQDQPALIRYEDLSSALVAHLPQLRDAYETELRWWSGDVLGPGPHVIYGDVLNPYIQRLFDVGDDEALRRVFAFVEGLAVSDDVRVQEVVAVTICERLGSDKEKLVRARCFMGPATRKICDEIESFWEGPSKARERDSSC